MWKVLALLCAAGSWTPVWAGTVVQGEEGAPAAQERRAAEAEDTSELPVPPLTGPVVDTAGMLDARARSQLESLARRARSGEGGQGVQLQFLTVPSLRGEPIETYAIRVAETWKLGTKGKDNGLLFVVSRDDRAVRIEVGGGLEGGLTDIQAGRIIRTSIVPAFRAGAYGEGLYRASLQALSALGAVPADAVAPRTRVERRGSGFGALFFIVFLLLLSIFRGGRGGRGRHALFWTAMGMGMGGRGFGGRGGFGGGGGGWGGGGGGFSGGGASGRW